MGYVWIYDGLMDIWHLFDIFSAIFLKRKIAGPKRPLSGKVCWEEAAATGLQQELYSTADDFQVMIVYSMLKVEVLFGR
jgi:hypothetical protein